MRSAVNIKLSVRQPGSASAMTATTSNGFSSSRAAAAGEINVHHYQEPLQEPVDTLERVQKWVVASRESLNQLTGPPLPPKPTGLGPNTGDTSIPYGYENVLPISQRYKASPYSMLTSITGDTDDCSTVTWTTDNESEYSLGQQPVRQFFIVVLLLQKRQFFDDLSESK